MMNNGKNEYLIKTKWTKIPNFRPISLLQAASMISEMSAPKIYILIFNFRNVVETLGEILTPATLNKMTFCVFIFCEIGGKVRRYMQDL
jgi:hypothetical protein